MHNDAQTVTLIFTIVTGIGVLLQAGILFGMFLAVRETQKKLHGLTDRLEEHVLPMVSTTRGMVEDLSPKLKIITGNLVDASGTMRAQAENVSHVVSDMSTRTRKQTARVDTMITGTLNSIGNASATLEKSIAAPLRQVNGVLAGLRAGIESLSASRTADVRRRSTTEAEEENTSGKVTPAEMREVEAEFLRERFVAER